MNKTPTWSNYFTAKCRYCRRVYTGHEGLSTISGHIYNKDFCSDSCEGIGKDETDPTTIHVEQASLREAQRNQDLNEQSGVIVSIYPHKGSVDDLGYVRYIKSDILPGSVTIEKFMGMITSIAQLGERVGDRHMFSDCGRHNNEDATTLAVLSTQFLAILKKEGE